MAKNKGGGGNDQTPPNKFKKWEEKTPQEKFNSHCEFTKMIIAHDIKVSLNAGKAGGFATEKLTIEEIDASMPFNPYNGRPFSNEMSLALRADAHANGYEKPMYMTMKQANILGAVLRPEVDEDGKNRQTKNGKDQYPHYVRDGYIKTHEWRDKVNAKGEPIQAVDRNGKPIFKKNGEPVQAKEKIDVKPDYVTVSYYHVSKFQNLDLSKLKEINLEEVYQQREKLQNAGYDKQYSLAHLNLYPQTAQDLQKFLECQEKGRDYAPIERINKAELKREAAQRERDRDPKLVPNNDKGPDRGR